MAQFVTLEQASDHLGLGMEFVGSPPDASEDPRAPQLQLKLDAAEAIILDYLKIPEDASPAWAPSARLEKVLPAAILVVLSGLWDDREGTGDGDYLAENGAVARLLRRFRDPAMA